MSQQCLSTSTTSHPHTISSSKENRPTVPRVQLGPSSTYMLPTESTDTKLRLHLPHSIWTNDNPSHRQHPVRRSSSQLFVFRADVLPKRTANVTAPHPRNSLNEKPNGDGKWPRIRRVWHMISRTCFGQLVTRYLNRCVLRNALKNHRHTEGPTKRDLDIILFPKHTQNPCTKNISTEVLYGVNYCLK